MNLDYTTLTMAQSGGDRIAHIEADIQRQQNELTERGVELAQRRTEQNVLALEVTSLRARRSNIDAQQIAMRAALCQALDLREDSMPFAGEMLQVHDDARDWEAAAERMLHSFALSLLVSDKHYARVVQWVDDTHLRGRLVYFRVRDNLRPGRLTPEASHAALPSTPRPTTVAAAELVLV